MTPRENLQVLLGGGCPDWIPFSLDIGALAGFTAPVQSKFEQTCAGSDPADWFDSDIRRYCLACRFGGDDPRRLHAELPGNVGFDEWGIAHQAGAAIGTTDRMFPPLAGIRSPGEVDSLPLPEILPADPARVRALHAAGYPVFGYAGSIYEWSWWLRGMERFMVDLVDAEEIVLAVVRRVEQHTTRLALASAEAGIDVLCFYDDVGTQRGMQISPVIWRQHIKPSWQRVLDAVRNCSPATRFFLHSCGRIDTIMPDIIQLGFHAVHPIQPECMDFAEIYASFGRKIVVCATISSQRTLPFGSVEEVRSAVRKVRTVVRDRRTLLMPSNAIQPETPWENVVALAQEARHLRTGRET